MNTKDYIESGTLDLYAAGLLSIEEMRDVELNACMYPEIKKELLAIQSSLENYALKNSIIPPDELKSRIMSAIDDAQKVDDSTLSKVVALKPVTGSNIKIWLVAASVALLIMVGVFALRSSTQISDLKNQVAELQNNLKGNEAMLNINQQQIVMLADAKTIRVTMKGTAKSPESLAMIYWNKDSKTVYLDIKNLPAAPSDKQYQLWFINSANQPVSAGVFDSKAGLIQMINANDALAFAVTLEPRGGSAGPTMDQMFVIGNVNS